MATTVAADFADDLYGKPDFPTAIIKDGDYTLKQRRQTYGKTNTTLSFPVYL